MTKELTLQDTINDLIAITHNNAARNLEHGAFISGILFLLNNYKGQMPLPSVVIDNAIRLAQYSIDYRHTFTEESAPKFHKLGEFLKHFFNEDTDTFFARQDVITRPAAIEKRLSQQAVAKAKQLAEKGDLQ